ncbi:hypothetical protein N9772_06175 [Bacteroidia bacterium]|jgi:hypothetical protein|nr:hypothetical protein [Bacteroidia bacterium]
MKKIIVLLSIAFIMGCSENSTNPSGNQSDNISSIGNGSSTGTGGSLARFTIAKNHLYIATESELFTYSLATASKPQYISKIALSTGLETIFSLGDFLYLGTQNGMFIYDITNASTPTYASNYWHVTSCDPVVANENYAFVTLRDGTTCRRGQNRLDVIDVRDKRSPQLQMSLEMEQPTGLGLYNNFLFVCDNGQIKRFNISEPTNPSFQKSTALTGVFDIIINGDILIAVHPEGVSQYAIESGGSLALLSNISKN